MQWRGVRRLSVCLSVRLSVNVCANRFFSQTNGRIATKLSQDWLQVSVHPGCAQGQSQGQSHVIRALSWILGMNYSVIDSLVYLLNWTFFYESRSTCLNLMAEITMAKQLLASEPCRLPACFILEISGCLIAELHQQCPSHSTYHHKLLQLFPCIRHQDRCHWLVAVQMANLRYFR